MPVTSLFRGLAEERDAVFVKAGSGPEIVRKGTRAGHTYELLGSLRGPYKRVEPLLVSLDDETEVFPLFQHSGIEILYMLNGVMEYGYGRQRYKMERGDTLQFEGDIPHGPDHARSSCRSAFSPSPSTTANATELAHLSASDTTDPPDGNSSHDGYAPTLASVLRICSLLVNKVSAGG